MDLQVEKRSLDELYEMQKGIDCERFPENYRLVTSQIDKLHRMRPSLPTSSEGRLYGVSLRPPFDFEKSIIIHIPEGAEVQSVVDACCSGLLAAGALEVSSFGNLINVPKGFVLGLFPKNELHPIGNAKISIDVIGCFVVLKCSYSRNSPLGLAIGSLSILVMSGVLGAFVSSTFWCFIPMPFILMAFDQLAVSYHFQALLDKIFRDYRCDKRRRINAARK